MYLEEEDDDDDYYATFPYVLDNSEILITFSQYSNLRIHDHEEYIIIEVQSKEHKQYTNNYSLH